ncbi:MAG: hypothetical protein ACREP6_03140 [Candidatus Binataceae bacterium]
MKKICAIVILVSFALPGLAAAHGVVGDYTFLEPLVADDANPKNEFDILRPEWFRTSDGRQFSLGFSFEKTLVPAPESYSNGTAGGGLISIEIGSAYNYLSPRQGPSLSGFDDLEILPKWAFLTIPGHEFRLSIGAKFILPTGDPSVEAQNHTQFGPELLWAKGWGDLPNWRFIKYLRPFGFQGDFGYLPALGGRTYHEMFADNVVEYSLPYLSNYVKDIGLKWPLRNMYLFTEFNYDQLITGPSGQTFPFIVATPGVAFMNYYLQISVATQLALNNASIPGEHTAVLGLLDLFIDDIIPATNWTPFD